MVVARLYVSDLVRTTTTTQHPIAICNARTYLHLHDCLLEAGSSHSLLSWLLAGGPGPGAVRSLKLAVALTSLDILPQRRIPGTHSINRSGIGGRYIGLGRLRGVRVVGLDVVLGETRDGGGVAGPGGNARSPSGRERRDPASSQRQHVEQLSP